ncbi:acyltransferase family protein [Clostridium perfringens]|uniref:Acyltransferase n=1 Tax=Clostridium perfringens TaxID=1502 RepID=A0A133NEW0_CLOPF|nr:acyltransferase family protein [Clostridium perfringens]KXA14831.1 acyltransferase [Clostridium perfringens]MDK0565334.1 acyltransferase family protein [Clostridium perfringens]MDK0686333.1 acyltransferase family protein [Clostridium perfringens]MDK0793620.1 acyltransferase family protein [Clostridium perfringens]MDM0494672.1 acyltransferase family protein [Clostridium perfringens]
MVKIAKKDQIRYINVLKALGIISVVMGHAGSPITNEIYLYHMALFFFITGYLYKESYENNFKTFFWKRVKSLYIPFVMFQIIFVLIRNILINIYVYDSAKLGYINSFSDFIYYLKYIITFNYSGDSMLGAIWFLKALFFVNILYLIFNITLKKLFKDREIIKFIIFMLLAVMGFYTISYGYNPIVYFNPHNYKIPGMFLSLFDSRNFLLLAIYYLGHLYRKNEEKVSINIYIAILFSFMLYIFSKYGSIDVSTYRFEGPFYFIGCAILGIYVNIYLAKKIAKLDWSLINYIGKNSLYIMLLHFLSFKLVDALIVFLYNLPINNISAYPVSTYGGYWWILYTIVGVGIPVIIMYIYEFIKLKIINKS